jgi:pimeloyl-ACP methyl ester carboxylesterase
VVTLSRGFAELADEFSLVAEAAEEAGKPGVRPRVRRSWVNVPTGGHVSGVIWGTGAPELVFLHDTGESARAWDTVAVASGRAAVAIDLPGHGRSDWRRDARYAPGRITPAVAEAIRSFAPRARLVVGTGLGGLTALALSRRHPGQVPGIVLVNTVPGTRAARTRPGQGTERFASREEAFAVLAARHPERARQALRRQVLYELVPDADAGTDPGTDAGTDPGGSWVWRHHPGNLPAPPDPGPSAGPDLACDELAQLSVPVTLILSGEAGPLPAADLARLRQRSPQINVVTITGAGLDIAATQPATLAAALDDVLAADDHKEES